jgi:glutamate dehydrogenase (NADP+)
MFGQYKRLRDEFTGVLTGKGQMWGGSPLRPEATGYGTCYFASAMLATRGDSYEGKTVAISGSGNVAQFAAQKALQLGAKVLTMSDSNGYIYDPAGIDEEKLAYIMQLKNVYRGRIREYVEKYPAAEYHAGERPWSVKCDIAMPCATQNELNEEQAKTLVANGCICVAEGANMPCTPEAIEVFQTAKLLYSPGKASNAGGVATSGLEMTQNSMRLRWTREEVDQHLKQIMTDIHEACVKYGTEEDGYVNYVKGANIAGFIKVAEAMMAHGLV